MLRLSLYSLSAVLCLSCLFRETPVIADGNQITVEAIGNAGSRPKQCQPGKTSAEALGWRWKPGTTVRIEYRQGDFNTLEVAALSRGVNGWNLALAETESYVVFIVDPGPDSVPRMGPSILVQRGVPKGRERVGELSFHSVLNRSAKLSLTISPVVTDLDALTSLMTHEIGHSMGLADCYECRRGTTAMAAFKGKNKGNDVYEPSECDRYVVAAGYAGRTDASGRLSRTEPALTQTSN
jgi:hypothetical protein